ncbi:MAG TPA: transglutaminase-like domain-containing protein, partial [Rhodocyclaceae bacterium]|nr:transglutaminase-like domain-containing protein [Rhodocyclaceae bacterium]
QLLLGAGLAALLLAARLAQRQGVQLHFDERDLLRLVDFSAIAAIALVLGLPATQGLPQGLLLAFGWLPPALYPLYALGLLHRLPVRLRHLAWSLRGSRHPQAERPIDLAPAYFALTLLAATILAPAKPALFWGCAALLLLWLFFSLVAPRRIRAFMLAAGVALVLGWTVNRGLESAHGMLEQWVVELLSGGADTDPYHSQTRIGDVGRIKLSETILWRVKQSAPPEVPLRLRTGVFVNFDGSAWNARHDAFQPIGVTTNGVARWTLQGESRQGVALLPMPLHAGSIVGLAAGGSLVERNELGVVRLSHAPTIVEFGIAATAPAPLSPPHAADRQLPPRYRKLLARLPELAALQTLPPAQRLAALEAWFAAHFRYTLFLGDNTGDNTDGGRDIERFLLHDRAGHCEYFGAATVLLLRALDIPARYVTGYSLQEYSRLENAYLVRSRHAHAWAEAWIDGQWREIDTTPSTWLAAEEDSIAFWRPAADLLAYAWHRLRVWRQHFEAPQGYAWGLSGAGLALAFWLLWRRRRPLRRLSPAAKFTIVLKPAQTAFQALEQHYAAQGLGRHPTEPARRWLARIEPLSRAEGDELEHARRVVERLYRAVYGDGG